MSISTRESGPVNTAFFGLPKNIFTIFVSPTWIANHHHYHVLEIIIINHTQFTYSSNKVDDQGSKMDDHSSQKDNKDQPQEYNSAFRTTKALTYINRQLQSVPLTSRTTATGYFYNGTVDNAPPIMNFATGEGNLMAPLPVNLPVYDIRPLDPSLLATGCQVVRPPTSLNEADLNGPEELRALIMKEYYEECEYVVQVLTGCTEAVAFHHRHRVQQKPEEGLTATETELKALATSPVPIFHFDNSNETAEIHLRKALGQRAETWLAGADAKWAIINVWRPVGDVVQQKPLVVAWQDEEYQEEEEEEISAEKGPHIEVVPVQTDGNYKSHFLAVKPPLGYKFGYVSALKPEEAFVFVNWASEAMGVRGLAHGAVEDHASVEGAPLRRSVEVRVLALFQEPV